MVKKKVDRDQTYAKHNSDGTETLNPVPIEWDTGLKRPEPLNDLIQRLVRTELSRQATEEGYESFEDADDFEVGDDYEDDHIETNYTLMEDDYQQWQGETQPQAADLQSSGPEGNSPEASQVNQSAPAEKQHDSGSDEPGAASPVT